MKIALLGYGKMGKTIEQLAIKRGHEIVLKVDKDQHDYDITKADVAIDFSIPTAAVSNISKCLEHHVPIISGTTGWLDQYEKITDLCKAKNGAFIYASNFSLGVNIFFELNEYLAKMMGQFDQYTVGIEEVHHTQKLDAPSGTAISLAEGIIKNGIHDDWVLDKKEARKISIKAVRSPNVPGTHTISYTSAVDTIDITHTAHSREGFALGAVIAAEWIIGKKGVFSMRDVLNIA